VKNEERRENKPSEMEFFEVNIEVKRKNALLILTPSEKLFMH